MRILLLLLLLGLVSCGDADFDQEKFPDEQVSTQLAYKRLAKHGRMEPVLEEGKVFADWQFRVIAAPAMETESTVLLYLDDGSGITYRVVQTPPATPTLAVGTLGLGTGTVTRVIRDLLAGEIVADLHLTAWQTQE